MTQSTTQDSENLIDVRRAAALVGRHPETIRRWIWTGRLAATRRGRRLLVAASAVQQLAGTADRPVSLKMWLELRRASELARSGSGSSRSAADLILEDRRLRGEGQPGARR